METDRREQRRSSPKQARRGDRVLPASLAGSQGSSSKVRGRATLDDGDLMQQLCLAVADLTLENAAFTREMRGYLEHTVLIPQEDPMIAAALQGAKEHEEEKRRNKGKNVGSAHLGICMKALQALAASDDLKQPEHSALKLAEVFWKEVVMVKSQQEMSEDICVFKVFKPKQPNKEIVETFGVYSRVVFRFKQMTKLSTQAVDLEEQLILYFKLKKWKVMSGTPPKAKKERDVQDSLRQFRR
eukprot:TRINITY_DN89435_c0_g1_i1.p1 TRINITY_DN89435_c0_g1~~TRINITY_DN89435_c0_g1_i1.p1  ORF type:complete len:242 (-),score=73.20 TRINITY_DN89435_c0_g1_i1:8-733(-)